MKRKLLSIIFATLLLLTSVLFTACGKPEDKLIKYLKKNCIETSPGEYGDLADYGDYSVMISYSEDEGLSFVFFEDEDAYMLVIDNFVESDYADINGRYLGNSYYYVDGYVDKASCSLSYTYIYNYSSTAPYYLDSELKTLMSNATALCLYYVNDMIEGYDIDITLADFGFENFD